MTKFNLVKVIDPSKITLTMTPRKFMQEFAPAYGDSWDDARDWLYDNPADYAIISKLRSEFKKYGEFRENIKVQLPMCDLDDRVEYNAAVANGMHRITVLRAAPAPIKFTPYHPYLPVEDVFTHVRLVFQEDVIIDHQDELFSWVRSMPLENGEWVETCMASNGHTINEYYMWLDKVVDHKLLLKKIHSLAVLDEFAHLGLTEIHIEDVLDDEDED